MYNYANLVLILISELNVSKRKKFHKESIEEESWLAFYNIMFGSRPLFEWV